MMKLLLALTTTSLSILLVVLPDVVATSVESNNSPAAAALDDVHQQNEQRHRRRLILEPGVLGNDDPSTIVTTSLPSWWNTVEANFKGENLKQCTGRGQHDQPQDGHVCSIKKKTCYFGNQRCGNGDDYPLHECQCSGSDDKRTHGTWSCRLVNCPACPVEIPTSNEQLANMCKKDDDDQSTRTTLQCRYGTEKCCGNVVAEKLCMCNSGTTSSGGGECTNLDTCTLSPTCLLSDWSGAVGKSCRAAQNMIRAEFPGMQVPCHNNSTTTDALIVKEEEDRNLNRVVLLVDAQNRVVQTPRVG